VRRCSKILATLVIACAGSAPSPAMAGESECYNDWSVAAAIVEKEKLATVEQLSGGVKALGPGSIVKTTLCKEDGKYVFRLVVRDKGALRTVTVDAHDPFKKPSASDR
jgi:hypothetical protein